MSLIRNLGPIGSVARNSNVQVPIQTSGQRAVSLGGTQGKKVGDGYQVAPTRNGANGVAQGASVLGRGVTAMATRLAPVAPLALTAGCDGDVASTLGLGAVLFAGANLLGQALRGLADRYLLGRHKIEVEPHLGYRILYEFKSEFGNNIKIDNKLIINSKGVGVKIDQNLSLPNFKNDTFHNLEKVYLPKGTVVYYTLDGEMSKIKLGDDVSNLYKAGSEIIFLKYVRHYTIIRIDRNYTNNVNNNVNSNSLNYKIQYRFLG